MDSLYSCLWAIRAQFMMNDVGVKLLACNSPSKSEKSRFDALLHDPGSPMLGEDKRRVLFESKFQRTLSSPIMSGLVFANINYALKPYVNVEEFCWSLNENFCSNGYYWFIQYTL